MSARSEIETRVLNWAKAQTPAIPVAIQGRTFNRPTSGPYLEVWLLGDEKVSRNVSADSRTYGMFQINCYSPANNTGMGPVESLRDSMVALFPVLPKTGTVSVDAPLSSTSSDVIDGFLFVAVRGNYRIES
jgi:hypothetical protein